MQELLGQLDSDYFVRRCAHYWHLRAKAAADVNNYKLAVHYLDRGAKYSAGVGLIFSLSVRSPMFLIL